MRLSIRFKLLMTFIFIIAAGYITILYFFSKSETKFLEQRAIKSLKSEANDSIKNLKHNLNSLKSEVDFLSQLEIMDDIIANDIDKRIIKILKKRKNDLRNNIDFIAFNNNKKIVASTNLNLKIDYNILFQKTKNNKIFILDKFLVFSSPVFASFDKKRLIGWLALFKPLKNISYEIRTSRNTLAWIIPPKSFQKRFKNLFFHPNKKMLDKEYIYVIAHIGSPLSGWRLGFALKKDIAFETIKEVKHVLMLTFIIMLFLTSLLTFLIDRRIVEPIRKLALTASNIVSTKNYNIQVPPLSKDEIGELANNFNFLMKTTADAFYALEKEKQKSIQTLIELMNFFEKIIKSSTKEETIKKSCKELKRLTDAKSVEFYENSLGKDKNCILLKSSQSLEKKDYGVICIQDAKEKMALEKRFFESVGRIISLQIDKIELLQTTKEALKSKTSFFSALSHELRTPLGSILSISQYLMTSPKFNEEAKISLGKIESSASHLLQIINDILTLAKAESGKLEPTFQECDIVTLCEESIEMMMPLVEAKELSLYFIKKDDVILAKTDPKLFKQILINLLSNSVKYTTKGEIKVILSKTDDFIELEVIDTGIGIEKEALGHIFDEFYREYRAKDESGSGLGLALSKKIAQILNGDLEIYSEGINKGTKAVFKIFL